jgi:hypothetical protein
VVVALRVQSVESNGPGVGGTKAEEGLDECGLAGTVGTKQGHHFAVVNVERHVVDGQERTELDREVGDLQGVAHDHRT